jgi:hypothetical protein
VTAVAERREVRTRPRLASDDEDRRYDEPGQEGNEAGYEDGRPPQRRRPADDRRRERPRIPAREDESLTAAEAAKFGLRQIAELTGKSAEGVAWVERSEDDGWAVGVEVVEDRRIPSAADILAVYETEMDPGGEMLSYRRVRRYSRGRGDDGNGG